MKSKIGALVAAAALCCFLAASAVAWACSPQSTLVIAPTLVPSVRESAATGSVAEPAAGTGGLQIRWGGLHGPAVAEVVLDENRAFSTTFQVPPETAPGVYYLVLASAGQRLAGAAVEVTGSQPGAAGAASADLWNGFSSRNGPGLVEASPAPDSRPQPFRALGAAFIATGLAAAAACLGGVIVRRRSGANR